MPHLPRPRARGAALAGILLVLALTAGCAGQDAAGGSSSEVTVSGLQATAPLVDRPWGRVSAAPAMEKAEPPGVGDIAFAREMIPHHRQALEISRHLLDKAGADPRVAASARFIVRDQRTEIAAMSDWLEAWAESSGGEEPPPAAHTGMRGMPEMPEMPGMVPQRRVDGLASYDVAAAQVEFLVLMVRHHEGAVTMAQDYLDVALNSFTLATARHIIREQGIEIAWMRQVIDELCAGAPVSTCPRT